MSRVLVKMWNKSRLLLVLYALLPFVYIGCFSSFEDTGRIRKILLIARIPMVQTTGDVLMMQDTISILFYKSHCIYNYKYESIFDNGKSSISTLNSMYFIHHNNDHYGYEFEKLNANGRSQMSVDSFQVRQGVKGFQFYDAENDSLLRVINEKGDDLVYVYVTKKLKDDSYNDTTCLYFTPKYKQIEYSYSKDLDSMAHMKLYKIRLIYNDRFSKQSGILFPKREWYFEMKPVNASKTDIEIGDKLIRLSVK